jgi:hypothetical protein
MTPRLTALFANALALGELAQTSINPVGPDDRAGGQSRVGGPKHWNTLASRHRPSE